MSKSQIVSRVLSLLFAGAYLWFAAHDERFSGINDKPAAMLIPGLFFPLCLIWFPESIANAATQRETSSTPPFLISTIGWILLVGIPVIRLWPR